MRRKHHSSRSLFCLAGVLGMVILLALKACSVVKPTSKKPDHTPPAFTLISPTDGQVNVPSPLTIQVRITDPGGVYFNAPGCPPASCYTDPGSIRLLLGNFYLDPISWDPSTNTLTYKDTSGMTRAGQCYSATVEAHDLMKNAGSLTFSFEMTDPARPDPSFGPTDPVYPCTYPVFGSPPACLKDTDGDGIPDDGVTLTDGSNAPQSQQRPYGNELHLYTTQQVYLTTDAAKRTVFIRPILKTGTQAAPIFSLWQEFINIHLPVVKVPFWNRGIELKVIDLKFNPYTAQTPDPINQPPVSIVEITYDLTTPGDPTYFSSMARAWYWGALGLTPYETSTCSNKNKYGYFRTTIYGNSVKRYFCDRQYADLTAGTPMGKPAYECTSARKSPMNFGNDGTVEFNPFVFDTSGTIQTPLPQGPAAPYTENQVIQRLIAHELGHTLLNASAGDHCFNPNCIMYGSLSSATGWDLMEFGPGGKKGCTHSPGKIYDIRPRVYNALNPLLLPPNYNCP